MPKPKSEILTVISDESCPEDRIFLLDRRYSSVIKVDGNKIVLNKKQKIVGTILLKDKGVMRA